MSTAIYHNLYFDRADICENATITVRDMVAAFVAYKTGEIQI